MASIDTAQLTALYQQQHRWLRSWLYRQLSCSHRAADLMQDTFMRLLASNEALEIASLGLSWPRWHAVSCPTTTAQPLNHTMTKQ